MKESWIWLDMDGTIADLYSVTNWLELLRSYKTTPYELAKPIYKMTDLLEVLLRLKSQGYCIGIISWSSKVGNKAYDREVAIAKKKWLSHYCMGMVLDEIIVTQYGKCKADTCRPYGYGILVDDEEQNRNAWDLGSTINAKEDIIKAYGD